MLQLLEQAWKPVSEQWLETQLIQCIAWLDMRPPQQLKFCQDLCGHPGGFWHIGGNLQYHARANAQPAGLATHFLTGLQYTSLSQTLWLGCCVPFKLCSPTMQHSEVMITLRSSPSSVKATTQHSRWQDKQATFIAAT